MKPVSFDIVPTLPYLADEAKEHMRKIDDPQDLNEALLSVRHEESMHRLQLALDVERELQLARLFFPPPHA